MNQKERKLIKDYSDRWNETFKECTGGAYVGRKHIERMLVYFVRSYKQVTRRKK